MLTFEGKGLKVPSMQDVLKELTKKNTPDRVECGENNEHWVYVQRSTKQVVLVSKVPGVPETKCLVKDAWHRMPHLTPAQLSACWRGLEL